ncbi:MAG: hypothetical protein EOS81_29685 [Mesorhizobium sp.]|uniref:hypothetical protein n=1 Tax=unclassified Mesorhizobium TaxID=325217 RepID=UPI000F765B5A|nr:MULTISPECIES: hypothetical protein [unclassified Mesorhizobium]RVC62052.1 hypothetical protein EN759_28280 [Mesorhizobium sp. M00.F.Ca.ET.038.03.1.1]RVC65386.1 hypothetical protein EN766_34570 [Mesorhizobium sp. M2A.F.Ca.ET.046.02.1.1]AZO36318.1 hypothetical protein EJ072_19245 [Mesorhizobium sp. M2A.F.Ca.ET.046.03.2.1]RWB39882.1 MAG: hypothetical protein EOQ44_26835 [Mesorhizobium sp.]RWE14894.1 MAG: hypothetical protein EOS76_24125 [Mesorhizobium sp.]
MSDQDDEFDDDEQRRRAAIIRRARVEGIEAAFESALIVCRDLKAPAQARASAQRTLLQIGGMLDRADRNATVAKDPAEMNGDELLQATEAALRKRKRAIAAAKPTGGAFD